MKNYVEQGIDPDDSSFDDGTMPNNVAELAENVIGHRIVKTERINTEHRGVDYPIGLRMVLDNGKTVELEATHDCCAFTELEGIEEHLPSIDHVITGVRTTEGYERWHIYADAGDVLELSVGWSPGNPFYYAYGFHILVKDAEETP